MEPDRDRRSVLLNQYTGVLVLQDWVRELLVADPTNEFDRGLADWLVEKRVELDHELTLIPHIQ
jgi:hypothetical protein